MATLYEYYNTGYNGGIAIYSATRWYAQTFTPSTAHKITSVKLLLYRDGSPGTFTVSIRATDGEGKPTGNDLCSGTTDGDTLTTDTDGEWREITLGDGYNLSADTTYAIVTRALDGNSSNSVVWQSEWNSPTYAGGSMVYSTDGSSWTLYTNRDMMFEDWGELAVTEKTSSDTGSGAGTLVLVIFCKFSSDVGYCGEVLEG